MARHGIQVRFAGAVAAFLLLWVHSGASRADDEGPLLLRDPSVSQTEIAFGYGGDIWIAGRDGNHLRRLTGGGHEAKPVFSPDGTQVAFVGDSDGARAVYVISHNGGVARRLTYHPADLGTGSIPDMIGWTPDGKSVLFNSRRASFHRAMTQLFTVPFAGGAVTAVPLPRGTQGSFSADSARIAYVPNVQLHMDWKQYRGGQTTPIEIADLADSSIQATIPRSNSNDFNPMWIGDTIYFLSDRDGPISLFAYDIKFRKVSAVVRNDDLDIKSAAACSDAIVYEKFGSLHLLDLKDGSDRVLDLRPHGDFPELHPHVTKVDPKLVTFVDVSNRAQVAFAARGEIFTIDAENGSIRNLTESPNTVERDPAWSPDAKFVAYFSDEAGEYALQVRSADNRVDIRKFSLGRIPGFYYSPTWSPDSAKIGYSDQRLNYWYIDLAKKTPVLIDTDLFAGPQHSLQLTWSPDSRWVAYTKQLPNHLHAAFLYSLDLAKSFQVTDGTGDVLHVAFDKNGEYLYLTASTDIGLGGSWGDMTSLQRPVTRQVYLLMLRRSARSPLDPGQHDALNRDVNAQKHFAERADRIEIDLEGINNRLVRLPIPARNYFDLLPGVSGAILLVEGPTMNPLQPVHTVGFVGAPVTVHRFDLRTLRTELVLNDVLEFSRGWNYVSSLHVSPDGREMIYQQQGRWFIARTDITAADVGERQGAVLPLQQTEIHVDPRAEWKHMYQQVWRNERDFFYDPGLHGLNLPAAIHRYEPYLSNLTTRKDLNYLFSEMLGNLTVGHVSASGGDIPPTKSIATGLLGADYRVENGHYRVARIYAGDPWSTEGRGPLGQPGVDVGVGDYLLAVDGREASPAADIYGLFTDTAGKPVVLTVGPAPDGTDSRNITVVPIADETALRSFAWVENNRREVDKLTGGRVAYVYVPDTYEAGYPSFNRDYFAQVDKQAAVIDARYNSGGLFADYFIENLHRPRMNYWYTRYGQDISTPQESIQGPKVMVINEMTSSGGDWLSWAFRQTNTGPLVGTRTWGGLVGQYVNPDDLLDGGTVTTPNLAFYSPNGRWEIENHGVKPDFEVDEDPRALLEGHDPQIEKAVQVVLGMLKNQPPATSPAHPPYPNYHTLPDDELSARKGDAKLSR